VNEIYAAAFGVEFMQDKFKTSEILYKCRFACEKAFLKNLNEQDCAINFMLSPLQELKHSKQEIKFT